MQEASVYDRYNVWMAAKGHAHMEFQCRLPPCLAELSDLGDVRAAGVGRSVVISATCHGAPKVHSFSLGVSMDELAVGKLNVIHRADGATVAALLRRSLLSLAVNVSRCNST